jgi:hypothetical protein
VIVGRFESGVPVLRATVYCAFVSGTREVEFRLAASQERTVVTGRALGIREVSFFAPDDATPIADLFGSLAARPVRILLTVHHDDGRAHIERVDALVVPGPPDESRLGMDVLERWVTVIDGPGEAVFFEPAPDE